MHWPFCIQHSRVIYFNKGFNKMTLEEKLELFKNSRFTLFVENEPINLCDAIEDVIFELEKSKKFNEELNKSFERLEKYTISGYEEFIKDLNKENEVLKNKLKLAKEALVSFSEMSEYIKIPDGCTYNVPLGTILRMQRARNVLKQMEAIE